MRTNAVITCVSSATESSLGTENGQVGSWPGGKRLWLPEQTAVIGVKGTE